MANRSDAKNYLSDPDEEMWTLYELVQQRPLYLLRVDRSAKELREIEGHDGSTPQLERSLAFDILKALDISADDEEAFVRVGAFHTFLDGQPAVESIEVGRVYSLGLGPSRHRNNNRYQNSNWQALVSLHST